MDHPDPWPLRHLVLRTPRLLLCPDDDESLGQLIDEANRGVHPPEHMPFAYPWTDVPREQLGLEMLRFHWSNRAALRPGDWQIQFLVSWDGVVVGAQHVGATEFAVTRECETGSWVGLRHQGRGIGTEMRAAVLQWAFDHLGARQVRSTSWQDNHAALAVSRKLGYVEDGTVRGHRRGEPVTGTRFLLTPETFVRPEWTLRVDGHDAVRAMLGADAVPTGPDS